MALFLNGKQLQCGNAIAAKPWTTLGTLTEGGSSLNVSGYTELLIYPKINGATYFDPIVIDVSEFNNTSTIHFSIYQDSTHSYMGGLDYSDGSISFRRILISGWTSCDCVVKATCFSSGGSTTHHYSTDEQVVGTWIDGSTLYERTLTTPTTSTTTESGISSEFSLSGVENVEIVGGYVDIGTALLPLNFVMYEVNYNVFTFYDRANAKIVNNVIGWTPTAFNIRIRYTKTSA
jgi:hypothetical protein